MNLSNDKGGVVHDDASSEVQDSVTPRLEPRILDIPASCGL
jgi:hypothetical protein